MAFKSRSQTFHTNVKVFAYKDLLISLVYGDSYRAKVLLARSLHLYLTFEVKVKGDT